MGTAFRKNRTIDIISMVKDVLRQWWCILLFAISISLLAGTVAELRYKPIYTVSTTFVVKQRTSNSSAYTNISSAKETADKFRIVLESSIFQRTIAKELGIPEYTADTTINVLSETNLMTLTVSEKTGLRAYRYMRAILDNYSTISDYVVKNVVIDIIEQPVFPAYPSNRSEYSMYRRNGFRIGIGLALLYIIYFSYMKDTVKNSKEVSMKLAARLIGSVYHESKALFTRRKTKQISMLITNPILSLRYTESCRITASRLRSSMDRRNEKTILVTSVAENEGKSTVTANLAVALAQQGKQVLLIDADFRKPSLYKIFQIPEDDASNLVEVLRTGDGIENIIRRYPQHDLSVILNNAATGSIDDILANGRLESLIKYARKKFDYVLLDTAPMGLVPDAEGIANFMDASLVVVRQDRVLARNINDAIDTLNATEGHVLGVVFNDAMTGMFGISGAYQFGRYGTGKYGGAYVR